MAFAAVTILMDTLHQHFLQPTPRFRLRNKKKVKLLYRNLSCLQSCLEELDLKDEAMKGVEAQVRDVSVELRFQIDQQLRLFYLGKAMKLRLQSAQKLLPILNRAIETMDFCYILDILTNHLALPVWRMPPHIKKSLRSFWKLYPTFFYYRKRHYQQQVGYEQEMSNDEQESSDDEMDDKEDSGDDEINDEQDEINDEQGNDDKQDEINVEQESDDDKEDSSDDEQDEINVEQGSDDKQDNEINDEQGSDDKEDSRDEWKNMDEEEKEYEVLSLMLDEGESIIRQELRASYLNKYMKQRIQARQRIRQLFMLGIKLTSHINKQLLKVKKAYHQSKTSQNNNNNNNTSSPLRVGDPLQHTPKFSSIKMEGCDDEFNTIMEKLNQQSLRRKIVSIVGMGGIGKSTLARRIYENSSFISHFDCRAWVTISQEYNPRQVFQCLLHSLAPGVKESSNNELPELVYRSLKHKRYFIIIDDIWSTEVWVDLMRCIQDDSIGSRVLLTTRLKSVGDYASSGSKFCHTMRFLDPNESWNLFRNKVLSQRIIFSAEFEKIAREIVDKCKGLPLAIIVAAGLLSNSNQNFTEWEGIAKKVATLSLDHSNHQCDNIIDLSYTFLPHHLKLCFLSFGCFPEDYEVDEDMIVEFWVSEGFLKVLRCKSIEDVARDYLQDLVDRNLVLIYQHRDLELSKVYQMHDVLRELALREAQKENLLCSKKDVGEGLRCRRRRIQQINSSPIQSKICNTSFMDLSLYTYMSTVLIDFKFLRALVLASRSTDFDNIFLEIGGLVHLRWLRTSCALELNYLPLFMFWNLQKLDIDGYLSYEPLNIWGLPQLRSLNIFYVCTLLPPSSVHHNLESIKTLDYRSCTPELFLKIPNLRTLKVAVDGKINPKCKAPNWFESLVYLHKLEELVVLFELHHREFRTIHFRGMLNLHNFLPNLKKLELGCTTLKWKDMDVVGMLSKLEVLKLNEAVHGKKWEPRDGGFRQLKFLSILDCYLRCWDATSDHFLVLECLVLGRIDLKEIPSSFADIATLKSIKLSECSTSLKLSAERIQEMQQDYGNDTFAVHILSWEDFDWD